jgi:hypothetical protein
VQGDTSSPTLTLPHLGSDVWTPLKATGGRMPARSVWCSARQVSWVHSVVKAVGMATIVEATTDTAPKSG